jgi:hypothetical protein
MEQIEGREGQGRILLGRAGHEEDVRKMKVRGYS